MMEKLKRYVRKKKEQYMWNIGPETSEFVFLHRNIFTPVQRSRPVSAFIRRHLLFYLDTTDLNAHLATLTYSTYSVESTAHDFRGTDWTQKGNGDGETQNLEWEE